MAEAHPVGFQYVVEAKRRGARIFHIDPRFTRTSALAHTYVPVRAGADIAFLGGVINYILANEKDFREYVLAYTNAPMIVSESFQDTEDLDGLFSGYNPETNAYDQRTWMYAGLEHHGQDHGESHTDRETASGLEQESHGPPVPADVPRDPTLQDPRCVYQILKRTTRATPLRSWSSSAASRRTSSSRSARPGPANSGPGEERPRWSTRWAGPSTASACSTSGPARSSSCCWATWAGPAAG
jgi:anaerobic selenocysteine-containing dehydrogenase